MGYVDVHCLSASLTKLTQFLSDELFRCPYTKINGDKQHNTIDAVDMYTSHSSLIDVVNGKAVLV
ncbi:hypothetical protein BDF14DRAFT_1805739 [Spinellus fusiger]|nr:hypothetical protein BDF14DRAFT_1805739 [Spinellus fusiger]